MKRAYSLSFEAALDLAQIWRHVANDSGVRTADRIERRILAACAMLARSPGVGHSRQDLTSQPVKVFSVYSYLILYQSQDEQRQGYPLIIHSILHGAQDIRELLRLRTGG